MSWRYSKPARYECCNGDDGVRDIRISLPIFAAGEAVTQEQWQEFSTTTVVSTGPTDSKTIKVFPHKFGTGPTLVQGIPSADGKYMYTPKNVSCFSVSPRNNTLENAPFFVNSLLFSQCLITGIVCTVIPCTATTAGGSGSIAIEETPNVAANNQPLTGRIACSKQWNVVTPSTMVAYDCPANKTLRRSNQKEFDPSCDWGIINVTTAFPTTAVPADSIIQVATLNISLSVSFSEWSVAPEALAIPAMTLNGGGGGAVTTFGFRNGSTVVTQPDYYNPNNHLKIRKGPAPKGTVKLSKDYNVDLGSFRAAVLKSRDPLNHPLMKKIKQSKKGLRALRDDPDTLETIYSTYDGASMYSFGGAHQEMGNCIFNPGYFMDATNYNEVQSLINANKELFGAAAFDRDVTAYSCLVTADKRDPSILRMQNVGVVDTVKCFQGDYKAPAGTDPRSLGLGAFVFGASNLTEDEYNAIVAMPVGINFPLMVPLNANEQLKNTIAQACAAPAGDAIQIEENKVVQTIGQTTIEVPTTFGGNDSIAIEVPKDTVEENGFAPPGNIEESPQNGFLDVVSKVLNTILPIGSDGKSMPNPSRPDIMSKVLSVVPTQGIKATPTQMGWFSVTLEDDVPRSTVGPTDSNMKSYIYLSNSGITLEDAYKYALVNGGNVNNNQYIQCSFGGAVAAVLPIVIGDKDGNLGLTAGATWGTPLSGKKMIPLVPKQQAGSAAGVTLDELFANATMDSNIAIFATRQQEDYKHAIQVSPIGGNVSTIRCVKKYFGAGNGQLSTGNSNLILKDKDTEEIVSKGGVLAVISAYADLLQEFRVNVPDKLPDQSGVLQPLNKGDTFYLFAMVNSRILLESNGAASEVSSQLSTPAVMTALPGFPEGFPNMQVGSQVQTITDTMHAIPIYHMEDVGATGIYVNLDEQ